MTVLDRGCVSIDGFAIAVSFAFEETTLLPFPSLTIQPLVENAIRHGVRIREEGVITVRSYLQAGNHVICIEDNGVGFDPDKIDDDNKQHIGIRNVRERIEMMCGGSLVIDSRMNEGTVVTIRIPQKEE